MGQISQDILIMVRFSCMKMQIIHENIIQRMKIKKILAMYIILGFNSFVRFHFKLIVDREILNQYKNRWIQNLFGINKKIK